MTLDTRVYVMSPVDHRALFVKCNQLIGSHEGIEFTDSPERKSIWNKPGQGLCALLDISYSPDGPLHSGTSHWDDCEPDCDYAPHLMPRWAEVSFDTTYGYRGDNGEGCGDLHARLVAELGQWLDSKGIEWHWKNELTGDVHERFAGLTELGSGGAEASEWFRTIAAPAIAANIASGGQS